MEHRGLLVRPGQLQRTTWRPLTLSLSLTLIRTRYDPTSSKDHGAMQRAQHAAFLTAFTLTADEVPLLKLDYSADRQRMFSPG